MANNVYYQIYKTIVGKRDVGKRQTTYVQSRLSCQRRLGHSTQAHKHHCGCRINQRRMLDKTGRDRIKNYTISILIFSHYLDNTYSSVSLVFPSFLKKREKKRSFLSFWRNYYFTYIQRTVVSCITATYFFLLSANNETTSKCIVWFGLSISGMRK